MRAVSLELWYSLFTIIIAVLACFRSSVVWSYIIDLFLLYIARSIIIMTENKLEIII